LLRHYERICHRFGVAKGTVLMRKYACCYAQGRHRAREFRLQVSKAVTPADFREIVDRYFPRD
jgi:tRNA-dihydrouridine synthase